jgi:hypothetical protein
LSFNPILHKSTLLPTIDLIDDSTSERNLPIFNINPPDRHPGTSEFFALLSVSKSAVKLDPTIDVILSG